MTVYGVARDVVVGLCRLYFRVSYQGVENVPSTGPFVLSPVHRSFIDFGLAAGVTRRRMRFMGKGELWRNPVLARVLDALRAFPVHRGMADREALRNCIGMLESGDPVVMFAEGTRRSGPEVTDLFAGPVYVAARVGVPVVPVAIGGSERAMRKGQRLPRPVKVHVIVGPPVPPPPPKEGGAVSRRAVLATTERLRVELQRLFDEAQRKAGVA